MTAQAAHFDAMNRRSTAERPIRDNAAIWSAEGPRILRAGRSHPLGQAPQRRLGFVQRHANGPSSGARLIESAADPSGLLRRSVVTPASTVRRSEALRASVPVPLRF